MIGEIFHIVAPVFLLIGMGFAAVKFGAFPREGVRYVMVFAQNFAVPMLLFNAIRNINFASDFDGRIYLGYYLPGLLVFLLGIFAARAYGRGPQSATVLGFNAYFANSVLIAIPISERAFGTDALTTNFVLVAAHSPIGYFVGALSMQIAKSGRARPIETLKGAAKDLGRNPLIIGIICGLAVNFLHIPIASEIEDATIMLSRAAIPAAVFALGGVLTGLKLGGELKVILTTGFLRLFVHATLVLGFASLLFGETNQIVKSMVLVAAMPTGTNGFIFASLYQREEEAAASIVFMTTLVSLITLPIWLVILSIT